MHGHIFQNRLSPKTHLACIHKHSVANCQSYIVPIYFNLKEFFVISMPDPIQADNPCFH